MPVPPEAAAGRKRKTKVFAAKTFSRRTPKRGLRTILDAIRKTEPRLIVPLRQRPPQDRPGIDPAARAAESAIGVAEGAFEPRRDKGFGDLLRRRFLKQHRRRNERDLFHREARLSLRAAWIGEDRAAAFSAAAMRGSARPACENDAITLSAATRSFSSARSIPGT